MEKRIKRRGRKILWMKLIIFGAPGAGKGTQAKILAKDLNLKHISTGEIFREEYKNKTKLGLEAYEKYWGKGNLVPDDITTKLVENTLKVVKDDFILDGFPRTIKQAEELSKICKINHVLVLDVPFHILKSRLLNRAKIEGRSDDTPETIKNRFKVYREQTAPLLKYYKDKIILIDGDNKAEDIKKDILKILKNDRSSKIKP